MRQVVVDRKEVKLSEVTKEKGYVMEGDKGNYILAQTPERKFIWVKATPGAITRAVHSYDTIAEAIKAKIDKYNVFEYDLVTFA